MCACPAAAKLPPDTVQKARTFHSLGDHSRALEVLNRYLVTKPADADALLLLADVLLSAKRPADAVVALRKLARLQPEDRAVLDRLAEAYELSGKPEHAAMTLEKIARKAPGDATLLKRLVRLYEASERPEDTAAALDRLVQLVPRNAELWRRLAVIREGLGHLRDARLAYETLRVLLRDDPAIWRDIGRLRTLLDQEPEAIEAYERAVRLEPHHVETLRQLANLYGWNDKPEARIRTLRKLLEVAPKDARARASLAYTLMDSGFDEEAGDEWETLIELYPNNFEARMRSASVHEATDDYGLALEHLEYVEEHDPTRPGIKRQLARVHAGRGDNRMALDLYSEVLADNPGDPTLRKVLEDLEISLAPRISARYELEQSNIQVRQVATVWFEHAPTRLIRYRGGYVYANILGDSFIESRVTRASQSHGGFAGLTLRLGARSLLDFLANANGYLDGEPFIGGRIKFSQDYANFDWRVWVARREDFSTPDTVETKTVVHDVHLEFDWQPSFLLFGAGGSYGRWRHDDITTLARVGNDGYSWFARAGFGILDDPLTIELTGEYTGESFEKSSEASDIPYFAPSMYQTVGAQLYLEQKPHWRVRWALYSRPTWVLEDEALQIVYGAELDFKFHPRHWLQIRFDRTDTAIGASSAIFNENLLMATYTGVF